MRGWQKANTLTGLSFFIFSFFLASDPLGDAFGQKTVFARFLADAKNSSRDFLAQKASTVSPPKFLFSKSSDKQNSLKMNFKFFYMFRNVKDIGRAKEKEFSKKNEK